MVALVIAVLLFGVPAGAQGDDDLPCLCSHIDDLKIESCRPKKSMEEQERLDHLRDRLSELGSTNEDFRPRAVIEAERASFRRQLEDRFRQILKQKCVNSAPKGRP